jgi:hypothetical protein
VKNLRFVAEEKETPDSATPTGYGVKKGATGHNKDPVRRRSSGPNQVKYAISDMEDSQRGDRSKDGKRRSSTKGESLSEKAFGPSGELEDDTVSQRQYSKRRGSLVLGEGDVPIESFLEINSKLSVKLSNAIKPVKDSTNRLVFEPKSLIHPGMNNISINENFALVVIWDPTGAKI